MEPIDFRNTTFDALKDRLQAMMLTVLAALRQHGPATTQELADKSGLNVLNVRPRVTDLVNLGFAELVADKMQIQAARLRGYSKGGVYRALTEAEAYALYKDRVRVACRETQGTLFGRRRANTASDIRTTVPTVVYRRLGRHKVWGYYHPDAAIIELDETLKHLPHMELETITHEMFHHLFPDMAEEEVEKQSARLAALLWRHNFRKVAQ